MDPRVVAECGDEVVNRSGERFEGQVLGLYEVREGQAGPRERRRAFMVLEFVTWSRGS